MICFDELFSKSPILGAKRDIHLLIMIYELLNYVPVNCYIQGIGNGIPLGAVVTTPEIAQVLTQHNYFNTFGGNPVCTAAGLAVLKVIEKEKLQENAHVVGSYLKERLLAIKDKYESKIFHFSFHPCDYYYLNRKMIKSLFLRQLCISVILLS